jgi:two-component system sensor histidine kinase BaeS
LTGPKIDAYNNENDYQKQFSCKANFMPAGCQVLLGCRLRSWFFNASIRLKLFVALLLLGLLAVGASYGMASLAFEAGFLRFVENRHAQEAQQLAERAGAIYREEGSWERLLREEKAWNRLHKEVKGGEDEDKPAKPEKSQGAGKGPKPGKLALLDVEQRLLIGREQELSRLALTPIEVDGRLVGYVGSKTAMPLSEKADIRFVEGLLQTFGMIALALCLACALLAWPLAHLFTRPLRRFAEASRQLSAGRLDTRLPLYSRDEFGALAGHFNLMAGQLEDAERHRRAWLADVSHELRTPLALLRAELEAMQDGVRPMDAAGLASLLRAAGRLEGLVDDLHQLARADSARQALQVQALRLDKLVDERCAAWQADFAKAGLSLVLHASPPCSLRGDLRLLGQLLDNLLGNALRYTDTGGQVEVVLTGNGDACLLLVRDSAPGVDSSLHERIFERFFRVETSRSRCHGGAGLGLAISRQIAEAHGGSLSAGPSPLGGLELRLSLPLEAQ